MISDYIVGPFFFLELIFVTGTTPRELRQESTIELLSLSLLLFHLHRIALFLVIKIRVFYRVSARKNFVSELLIIRASFLFVTTPYVYFFLIKFKIELDANVFYSPIDFHGNNSM